MELNTTYICCSSTSSKLTGVEYCDNIIQSGGKCNYDSECVSNYCEGNAYGAAIGNCKKLNELLSFPNG